MMDTSSISENVKVVVRVRPLSETEKTAGYKTVVKVDSVNNSIILRAQNNGANGTGQSYNDVDRSFVFDSVFGQESSQVCHFFLFFPTKTMLILQHFHSRWKSTTMLQDL